jgi:hypothetical protein
MKAEPGILQVEKNSVRFRFVRPVTKKQKSLEISNTGPGLLQGHLFSTRPWLMISPKVLTIAPSAKTICTMTLDTDTLSCGFTDRAFINIITNSGNDRVQVELSMMPFSFNKLIRALLYFSSGSLLALPLVVITLVGINKLHLPPNYWQSPLFWAGAGVYFCFTCSIIFAGIRLKIKNRKP